MTSARMDTLARLQQQIDRLDGETVAKGCRVSLGDPAIDATLQGGLAVGAMHEVFAAGPPHIATATGFIAGLAQRITAGRPLLWVRQDFSALESGALFMSGWSELGLDPRLLVMVHAADVEMALRTTADALACDALGAVVLEVWGEARRLDLVASRRLTLTSRASGVTGLVLRAGATPSPSTAETRWIVRAAHSPPGVEAWGAPTLDAQLVRNRHGPNGHWIMEWNCDDNVFHASAAHPQPAAAASVDRSYQTANVLRLRGSQPAALDRGREAEQRLANYGAG